MEKRWQLFLCIVLHSDFCVWCGSINVLKHITFKNLVFEIVSKRGRCRWFLSISNTFMRFICLENGKMTMQKKERFEKKKQIITSYNNNSNNNNNVKHNKINMKMKCNHLRKMSFDSSYCL